MLLIDLIDDVFFFYLLYTALTELLPGIFNQLVTVGVSQHCY